MKGEICPWIGMVNKRMDKLGLESHSSAYFCQTDSYGGGHLKEIVTGGIPDYELK